MSATALFFIVTVSVAIALSVVLGVCALLLKPAQRPALSTTSVDPEASMTELQEQEPVDDDGEPESFEDEDQRLDDPRHGQAAGLNRENRGRR